MAKERTLKFLNDAGIMLTETEKHNIEIVDYGLKNLEEEGLQLITYVNNNLYCAKELILFPSQTCPEHKHPFTDGKEGKTETFRCRKGKVYLYIEGNKKIL